MNRRILIRCDGSPRLGLGHVVRCLVLADELRDHRDCEVIFAIKDGPMGIRPVEERGYIAFTMDNESWDVNHEESWLKSLVKRLDPVVLVLDIRSELSRKAIEDIRSRGIVVVTLDDSSERRLSSDMVIYPPVPQVEQLDWSEFSGIRHIGWEWVLLRPEFAKYRQQHSDPNVLDSPVAKISTVLITMGATDPAGLTLKVIQALELLTEEFSVVVILGSGFQCHTAIRHWTETAKRKYELVYNPCNIHELMRKSDLAVVSFGVTAYELAALGVPSIHLCISDDHAMSSSAFDKAGMSRSLGIHVDVSLIDIASAVRQLLGNQLQRQKMQKCCLAQPIGDGYLLTASAIVELIQNSQNPVSFFA